MSFVEQCIEFSEHNMLGGMQHVTDGAREEWKLANNKEKNNMDNMIEYLATVGDANKLYEAIGKAMSNLEGIPKSANGQKGHQKFKYAPYHVLRTALLKVLSQHQVSWIQPMHTDKGKYAHTLIVSGHGSSVVSTIHFECDNDPQEIGRVSTYMRRYQLQAFFGLEGDRDFDDDETSTKKEVVKYESVSVRNTVADSTGSKPVEAGNKESSGTKQDETTTKVNTTENGTTTKVVSTLPNLDVKSANAKIYDCMKQLGWAMTDFGKYCEELSSQGRMGEFHGPAKMTVDQKNLVINLLVTEKGCAPF